MQKYNEYEEQYETDQQSRKYFDNLHKKSLQDKVIDKFEYESLCHNFTKDVKETKFIFFLTKNKKIKINFFSDNKTKIVLEPRSYICLYLPMTVYVCF